ncbi:MAG: pyridoxamine 5'-phosphate oxidase family protein [Chloroflexi bacterium]|nr:pyridoxamine 5'-phosphate oxidase family protein [Chloroflexota bacterium]
MSRPPTLSQLLISERYATLATLSISRGGWPFASVVSYATDAHGQPLLLLSELAEHTRNLRSDPRASLLVRETAADDPQASARVTLLGTLQPDDEAAARQAYVARHPQAEEYLQLADFHTWCLSVTEARYVNGFGDMGWLSGEALRTALAQ